jgi:hypothetical protein
MILGALAGAGCKTSNSTALQDSSAATAAYSAVTSLSEAPPWVAGDGQLIWQESFSAAGLTSEYRAWIPPQRLRPSTGFPIVLFFHGNIGSNYGPVGLQPDKIKTKQASEKDAGSFQRFPTLEQARFEASGGAEFWNRAIFVAILSPSFTQKQDQSRQYINRPSKEGYLMSTWGSLNSELSMVAPGTLDRHAEFVSSLLRQKFAGSFDPKRVVVVGQSGGALFASNSMLPRLAKDGFSGSAVLLCGIDTPVPSADVKAAATGFNLHFHTTESESDGLRGKVIPGGLNAYGAHLASDEWRVLTEDEIFKNGNAWRLRRLSIQVDGKGKHCDFDTKSQPAIVTKALCRFHQWEELGKCDR